MAIRCVLNWGRIIRLVELIVFPRFRFMGEHAGRATIGELHPVPASRVVVSPAYLLLCDGWWQSCGRFDLRSVGVLVGFPGFGLTIHQPYHLDIF